MEDHREVVVLSAVRTPIGKYGGGLASVPPRGLAAAVVREAVSRAAVAPADTGHAVFGQVIHTEVRDMCLSRVAAVNWASRSRPRPSPSTGCAAAACRRSSPQRRRSGSATVTPRWPAARSR
jgi:acetyl-CoA acetyltransferase